MINLSPAAQAVLDAVDTLYKEEIPHDYCIMAAALRAAALQAESSVYGSTPSTDWGKGWKEGVRDAAKGLLAIATELEETQ